MRPWYLPLLRGDGTHLPRHESEAGPGRDARGLLGRLLPSRATGARRGDDHSTE